MCTATRAALLTGRYPSRFGLQYRPLEPWSKYGLPLEERTLAQALQQVGYATAIVGKKGTLATTAPPTCRRSAGLSVSTVITWAIPITLRTIGKGDWTGIATTNH